MIKVLIADDHAIVRRGLRQVLADTADIFIGGEAATSTEALQRVRDERWDVVVLDINLPEVSGIDLLGEIRRARPGTPVLILTVYSERQYALRAIKAGAAGFLTKDSAPDTLIEAVRKVATGGRYVSPELAEALASALAGGAVGASPHELLTAREFEVLRLIGSGLAVSEIARNLGLSVKTVSTHRARILVKMSMRTNAELTHYAIKNGLVV